MKTLQTQLTGVKCLSALLLLLPVLQSFSQAKPDYSFTSYTLESGTDRQAGAVYRYSNVKTNTDALVKILSVSGGITIQKMDRTADGYAEAFQPEIKVPGGRNGYVDFQISFVKSATNILVAQPEITASALDIDGDTGSSGILYEFNQIDMGGGVVSFNTLGLQIQVIPVGTAFKATNITGILFGASVDTSALDVMYTVKNAGISSFTWRTGVNNLLNTSGSTRYTSLYFKNFNYSGVVLSSPKIINFQGTASANTVSLGWQLTATESGYTCQLEKAGADNQFVAVDGVSKNNATDFSYSTTLADGRSLYRVRLTGPNDQVTFSNVLSFAKGTAVKELKVYPSVVTAQQFTMNIAAGTKQQGMLQVVDYAGRIVYKKELFLNTGSNSITINDLGGSLKGNYLVVAHTAEARYANKIVIQ